jgi:polyhydroxyalkanoate synthesis regulator phasin
MRRLIWLPVAGFLLIAGAAIAAAAAAPSITPLQAALNDAASPAPTVAASPGTISDQGMSGPGFGHFDDGDSDGLLAQVLSDLVKAGTITQAQSDAVTNALTQAVTNHHAQMQQQRQQMQQEWTQVQGFLQDGVITQDEINQLPADSALRQAFNSIAQDGKISIQQLEQLLPRFGRGPGIGGFGHGRGHDFGPGWGPGARPGWGSGNTPGQDPHASPGTSGTSS